MISSVREWVIGAALTLGSICLIYLAMEAYVEFFVDDGMQFDIEMWRYSNKIKKISSNSQIGHEHRPNAQAKLMGVDVKTNALGLRNVDVAFAKPPKITRILMLGDSLAFGWGVPMDKTYSKQVESILRAQGQAIEVINSGVGNFNTSMEVEYFFEHGLKLRPDIVVLNYFINDAEPMPTYSTNVFNRNLRAYVYFASRLDAALRSAALGDNADWKQYYGSLYDEQKNAQGLGAVRSSVARLAKYCRENGIQLLLANYPELRQLKDYPFPNADDFVRQVAKDNGIEYFSLLPSVIEKSPPSLWVTVPDPHPSVEAHTAFARALVPNLRGLMVSPLGGQPQSLSESGK